jgi:hypothetical protein
MTWSIGMSVVEVLGCRYSAWRDPPQVRDRFSQPRWRRQKTPAVREGAGRRGGGHDSGVCGMLGQFGVVEFS